MSLLSELRRVSQSFNTLISCRLLSCRQSPSGRVLFFAVRSGKEKFYSAEIQKGGTIGPATRLPRIPFERIYYEGYKFHIRNGLICVRVDGKFHIFNSHTGETVSTLPDDSPVPTTIPPDYLFGTYLIPPYFGFDPLSKDYKLLLIQKHLLQFYEGPSMGFIWIFSTISGSWRRILHEQQRLYFDNFNIDSEVVFVNGALHWFYAIGYRKPQWKYDAENDCWNTNRNPDYPTEVCIMAFDMADEKFRKITDFYFYFEREPWFSAKLTEFGGRLAVIQDFSSSETQTNNETKYDEFRRWILEDYKNKRWVKKTFHLPFKWMMHHQFLAFNNNTGEILLQPADVRRKRTNCECLLYYSTTTEISRRPKITGLSPRWWRGEIGNAESNWSYIVDVTFDSR